MKLSEHFTLDELTHSDMAISRRLDNTPTPAIQSNLKRLALLLEEVRKAAGGPVIVSSGYRSPAVNAAVGGSDTSAHRFGLAADINCRNLTPIQLAEKIIAAGIVFDQLIYEQTWVHIGLREGEQRCEILTAHFVKGKKTTYTKGI